MVVGLVMFLVIVVGIEIMRARELLDYSRLDVALIIFVKDFVEQNTCMN